MFHERLFLMSTTKLVSISKYAIIRIDAYYSVYLCTCFQ